MRCGKLFPIAAFLVVASPTQAQRPATTPRAEIVPFSHWKTLPPLFNLTLGAATGSPRSGPHNAYFAYASFVPCVYEDSVSKMQSLLARHNYSPNLCLGNASNHGNDFRARMEGVFLLNLLNQPVVLYQQYAFTLLGAGTDTLTFAGRQVPKSLPFDDIAVPDADLADVPEPDNAALFVGMILTGAGFLARRRKQVRSAT